MESLVGLIKFRSKGTVKLERGSNSSKKIIDTIALEIGWGSIERLLGLLWRETEGRTYNSRDEN